MRERTRPRSFPPLKPTFACARCGVTLVRPVPTEGAASGGIREGRALLLELDPDRSLCRACEEAHNNGDPKLLDPLAFAAFLAALTPFFVATPSAHELSFAGATHLVTLDAAAAIAGAVAVALGSFTLSLLRRARAEGRSRPLAFAFAAVLVGTLELAHGIGLV